MYACLAVTCQMPLVGEKVCCSFVLCISDQLLYVKVSSHSEGVCAFGYNLSHAIGRGKGLVVVALFCV